MGMIPTRRRGCWDIISGVVMSSDLISPKLLKHYAEPWPSPPPPQEDSHEFLHALLDAVERDSRRGLVSRFLALVPLAEAAASACRTLSVADAPPTGLPGQRPFRLHARPACRARQRGVGLAPGNRAQWRRISGLGAESSALPSAGLRRKASDARLVVCAGLEPWSRPGREAGMQWIRLVRAQRGSVGC